MENSEFKPFKFCLKIDLVSPPARAEGLGKYIHNLPLFHMLYIKLFITMVLTDLTTDIFDKICNELPETSY